MPFLRFTRDKRGYETTSLVHADRGRQGRARQRVLYWFRSPPGVKVGRPALDQDAIRWIEEHNPDIEFDWTQILQASAPPAPPAEDARGRRPRRGRIDQPGRTERPARRTSQRSSAPPPTEEKGVRPSFFPDVDVKKEGLTPFVEEAIEQITHPDIEPAPAVAASAVETVLGREQLIRFRARYAELQARIIERGGEPARVDELRAQAETLNPDAWVTLDEARKGVQEFESKIRDLRAALGLKRRRRSRRGGRRRSGGPSAGEAAGSPAVSDVPASNSSVQGVAESPPAEEDSVEGEAAEEDDTEEE